MSDPRTKKIVHMNMISAEYNAACKKHPKFCDKLANDLTDWARLEKEQKAINDDTTPPYYGENLILEELAEALHACQNGDKAHALQELAQCGAVILRMMDYVQNEMEAK